MGFILKYPVYFTIAGILLLALILWLVFGNNSEDEKSKTPECPDSFTLDPVGGVPVFSGLVKTTFSKVGDKYYKQLSGGYGGASGQLPPQEITAEIFYSACKTYNSESAQPQKMKVGGVVRDSGVSRENSAKAEARNKAQVRVNELIAASRKQIGSGGGSSANFPVYYVGECYHSSIGGGPNAGKTAYCCLIMKEGVGSVGEACVIQ